GGASSRGALRRTAGSSATRATSTMAAAFTSFPRVVVGGLGGLGVDGGRHLPARLGADEAAREKAPGRRRRHDDLNLVAQLVGQRLLDQQRVLRDQRRIARQLRALRLARDLD